MPEQASWLLFAYKLLNNYSTEVIALRDGPIASVVTSVGQEKYYVYLICGHVKHFNIGEKSQEKVLGRMSMSPVRVFYCRMNHLLLFNFSLVKYIVPRMQSLQFHQFIKVKCSVLCLHQRNSLKICCNFFAIATEFYVLLLCAVKLSCLLHNSPKLFRELFVSANMFRFWHYSSTVNLFQG